jgi:hypothetical protein
MTHANSGGYRQDGAIDPTSGIPRFPGLVIAYHGCDKKVVERVVSGEMRLADSENDYDWLGWGQYFWEGSPQRAFDWASDLSARSNPKVDVPAVVGAVIDMGYCLNLVDAYCIDRVRDAYLSMKADCEATGRDLPENKNVRGGNDWVIRRLDCAVINFMCRQSEAQGERIDTVRGVFIEGAPLYRHAGFMDKTHIQICVRNPNCIKGYFLPRDFPPLAPSMA